MLFFLMLFALTRMTLTERQMLIEGLESALSDQTTKNKTQKEKIMRKMKEEDAIRNLQNQIQVGDLANYAEMNVDDKSVKITLNVPVFFASGSAGLNENAFSALEGLVYPLGEFQNDIIIEGHTDNVPIKGGNYRSNWELSVARAVTVIDYLTALGLNPRQLVAGGYGEYHPRYPNDSEENRARNRRIEITIIRQTQD